MPKEMRPVWYVDWRELWHYESKVLGWMVAWRFDGQRIVMDRKLYKQITRCQRIEARLKVESKVMDETWCKSVFEILFGDNDD